MKNKLFFLFFYGLIGFLKAQQPILTINSGHQNVVSSVCFSPNCKYALSGSLDNTIKLWDVATGKEIRTFSGHGSEIVSVSFSPDGNYFLSLSDGEVKIWNISNGLEIRSFSEDLPAGFTTCISSDGKFALTGSHNGNVYMWDILTGNKVLEIQLHPDEVRTVCFSPDNKYVLSGGFGPSLKLFDRLKREVVCEFNGHKQSVQTACFSSDNKYILSGSSDNTIKLWDIPSGKEIQTFTGHNSSILYVCFSPDLKYVYSISYNNTVIIWELSSGKEIRSFQLYSRNHRQGSSKSACFSENGKYILSGDDDNTIRLYNASNGEEIRSFKGQTCWITSLNINSNGKYMLSGGIDGMIKFWDLSVGKEILSFSSPLIGIESVSFSNDDNYVISSLYSSYESSIKIWNIANQVVFRSLSISTCCGAKLGLSANGEYAISLSNDSTILFWDINRQKEVFSFTCKLSRGVKKLCLSPNNEYLIEGTYEGKINLWNITTGKKSLCLIGHKGPIESIYSSIDGKFVLSGGSDGTLKLWDVSTGKQLRSFVDQARYIFANCLSPKNNYCISGSSDGTIKFWNIFSSNLVMTIYPITNSDDWIVVTPDGRFDGTEEGMKLLYYVKGMEIISLESTFEQFYTPNLIARVLEGEQFSPNEVKIANLKSPPIVKIINPKDNEIIHSNLMVVKITATDQGGGIDEIRLYQNGKLVEGTRRGFKPLAQTGSTQTATFSITLANGQNTIKATAFNTERTESSPDEITVNYQGVAQKSDLHVFVIGINSYKNSKYNLSYALPDAQSFFQTLQTGSKEIFGNISTYLLKDDQATKTNILNTFSQIKANAKEQDVFVFYYAGHGVMSEGSQTSKSDFFLAPYDITTLYGDDELLIAKGISSSELMNLSKDIKAQKQWFILDACQSGGALETFASRGAAEEKALVQLARSSGIALFAASGTDQFSSEFQQLKHGVFTYVILQGLQGFADGGTKDRKITVSEMKAYIDDQVPELTQKYKGQSQYPQSIIRGMDFPIAIAK